MSLSLRFQRRVSGPLRIAAALLLVAVAAQAQSAHLTSKGIPLIRVQGLGASSEAIVARRPLVCGTSIPSATQLESVRSALGRWREENLATAPGGTIRVAFHVITARGEGEVSDTRLADQIQALNRDYAASGYRFELASVDRTEQAGWLHMTPGSGKERKAKQALAIDPARHLNIYVCALGQNLHGWSSLPWSEPEGDVMQGVVLDYATLPGGVPELGQAASHEVAHYLGLLPPEGVVGTATVLGGDDLERMRLVVPVYRPSLFTDAPPAGAMAKPEISPTEGAEPEDGHVLSYRGAFPNPFRAEAALRFTLPISEPVSLRVYSVTGQLVRMLVDATLPAGDHSAMFRAEGLPSGAYFAVLKAGSVQMSRTLMLIR
jgi:hypothetical protein